MKPTNRRRLTAVGAATLTLLLSGSTAYAATDPSPSRTAEEITPYIVGGTDATRPWPGMASLQIDHQGDPNWHICGASLIDPRWAVTNAHCVTQDSGAAADPGLFHLRIGSTNRTSGGVVATVDRVIPHPAWDWATGDNPVADIALLRLTTPVQQRPFTIARAARPQAATRLLGWGLTTPDATDLPVMLQQLDTRLVSADRCAAAGITAGEICVDNTNLTGTAGTGSCHGDSGGPALQRSGDQWRIVGGTSRETVATCGDGPTVYTDASYYRPWIAQVIRTGDASPARPPARTGPGRSSSPLIWTGTPL